MKNTPSSPAIYSLTARVFHWITATVFLIQFPIGLIMVQLGTGSTAAFLSSLHKMLGFLILWLSVLRLSHRFRSEIVRQESKLAGWHLRATNIAHAMIYALLILVPTTGWLGASAFGSLDIFGLLSLPALMAPDEARALWLLWAHSLAAFALMVIVALHVGFAMQGYLEHHGEPEELEPAGEPATPLR